ncbi:MAG: aminotransferase class III-fold pyridoxal phosphate-dependent enzyme [Candidatus Latescibacterota bacterium]|jgi:putrescine aminotransferase
MDKSERPIDAYRDHLNPNNADFLERVGLDKTVAEAKGAVIRDVTGREFVDFLAGYGVFNLGHNPARITEALRDELGRLPLWNRPFVSEPLARLASRLARLAPGDLNRVFMCSTGAEAIESSIKLARLATRRPGIVAAQGAFHGFTLGALSASGIPGQSRPFKPLLPGITHVPFGDVDALAGAVSDDTAAVLLEPFQAEIGAATPPEGYLTAAREVCDRTGTLLMIDEVRTGMGRTGPMFAVEHEGVVPDVLMLGKSLAGGIVPIGAMVARDEIWGRFGLSFSMSASSFAGNRLACVAALAALDVVEKEGVLEAGRSAGERLWRGLEELVADFPGVLTDLTGKGMLVGVHLPNTRVANDVVTEAVARDLLLGTAFCNGRCILIEPPLVITPAELDRGLTTMRGVLEAIA